MVFAEQKKLFHWRQVKRNKKEYSVCRQVMVATVVGLGATTIAKAEPTGGEITSGSGSITQSGTSTDILQATQRLDINWQTFSTNPDESINFQQPNSTAVAINRVIGGVPSFLEGALNANGRVFILNQAGIVFAQGATVNVAALLATTAMDVDVNDDVWNFSGTGYGSVLNHGQITVSDGGFAVLAAPYVENTGIIKADLGQIQLAGTNTYTMDLRGDGLITFSIPDDAIQKIEADGKALGVNNEGTLQARSGIVGMTARTASDLVTGAVNLSGVIDADSFSSGKDGGSVQLVSKGDINFTGNATVSVNGGIDGNGGEVRTWADGVNNFNAGATISARGGDEAGDGGLIELSGHTVKVRGMINASAPNGEAGSFLLDPDTITIKQGTNTASSDGFVYGSAQPPNSASTGALVDGNSSGSYTIYEGKIEQIANGFGTKVILEAYDLITMEDLSANYGDGILDVGAGGITMRILDDNDHSGRIEFQNPNNMIRATTGDITIEVNGDNTANGSAEIEIGNLRTGVPTGFVDPSGYGYVPDIAAPGKIFINAPYGSIKTGAITILASTNNPTPEGNITQTTKANLFMYAGEDITIGGPVQISANRLDESIGGRFDAYAYANVTAYNGYIDIQNDFNVNINALAAGSALLNTSEVNAYANFFAGSDISIAGDVNVAIDFENDGGAAKRAEIFASLDMIAGGGVAGSGTGYITVDGNINVVASLRVANPLQRGRALADAYILAANSVTIAGTTDTDGYAGISVLAESKNGNDSGDSPGRAHARATLTVAAGYGSPAGGYGNLNVYGDVFVFGSALARGKGKSVTTGEADAQLIAYNDINIYGDTIVTALGQTLFANPAAQGTAFATATLTGYAGLSGYGSFYVGGDVNVLASANKSGLQERGYTSANASAEIRAANDAIVDGGISVTALAQTVNGIQLYGTNVAYANLYVDAGTGSSGAGAIEVGDSVSVVASADISGIGYHSYAGNVHGSAYATLTAPDGVTVGDPVYGGGITVRADGHNNILNDYGYVEMHSAAPYAYLSINVNNGGITVNGPVLVSADADKIAGTGNAYATANADLNAYSYIHVNGDFTVAADAYIGPGATSGRAFGQANADLLAGTSAIYNGDINIYGDVNVTAVGNNQALYGTDADASAILSIYAGGSFGSNSGSINIAGDLVVTANATLGDAYAGSNTVTANASADLYAAYDINIGSYAPYVSTGVLVSAAALSSGTSAAPGVTVYANATLTIDAGNNVSGSYLDQAYITVGGPITVSAKADQYGSLALSHGASAFADAYIRGPNDITIDGGITVSANAYSTALGFGTRASAFAYLYIDAGTAATAGDYGNLYIGGPVLVDASASVDNALPSIAPVYATAKGETYLTAYGDIYIDGGLTIEGDAILTSNVFAGNTDAYAYGRAIGNIRAGQDVYIGGDLDVHAGASNNAYAFNNGPFVPDAVALAYLNVDGGTGGTGSTGYIIVDGDLNVTAAATLKNNAGFFNVVYAGAYADLESRHDDIYITGDATVMANAQQLAASGLLAFAYAELDMEAGFAAAGDYDLIVGGDVSVMATAYNASVDSGGGKAYADAYANLQAANDVFIYGGSNTADTAIKVTANADAYAYFAGFSNTAYAFAETELTIIAGNNGSSGSVNVTGGILADADAKMDGGPYAAPYGYAGAFAFTDVNITAYNDINISGPLTVTAEGYVTPDVGNQPSSYAFYGLYGKGVIASANADLYAGNNVYIGDDVTVMASARNEGVLSTAQHYGGYAYAGAYLDITAGGYGPGNLTVNGNTLVRADAEFTGTKPNDVYGYTYVRAIADASLQANNDIILNGNMDVLAYTDAEIFASDSYYGFNIATASLRIAAGTGSPSGATASSVGYGDFTITGNLTVSADANLNDGTGMYLGFEPAGSDTAAAYAYAYLDINTYQDINIGGTLTVNADAFVDNVYAQYAGAYAYAYGFLTAGSNIDINNDITVTATAVSYAGYASNTGYFGGFAAAAAYLDMAAGVNGTGSIDIDTVTNGVTVSAVGFAPYAVDTNADVSAEAYLTAANDIDIYGDITVTAYARGSAVSSGIDMDATAEAYLGIEAGTNGPGSLTITGDTLVSAAAYVAGAYGGTANAEATADAYLTAANDISVTGNISVIAYAEGNNYQEDNDASANLDIHAGTASPSGATASTYGYGDFTITGDILVDATVIVDGGTSGFEDTAGAYMDIDAFRDIGIDGSVTVSAQGFVTSNATDGNNNLGAYAYAYIDAGRNIGITGDVTVTALADNQESNSPGDAPDAKAIAYLRMEAGTGAFGGGYIDIGGNITVDARGYIGVNAAPYGEANASAYAYLTAHTGGIHVGGDVDINAYALVQSQYGGSGSSAYALLFMNAGITASGDYDLIVDGDINVTATHIVDGNSSYGEDVTAYAYARLRAANDINLSYQGTDSNAINVQAIARNLHGSTAYGNVYATANLYIEAGISSSGNLDVYGGINVTADAYVTNGDGYAAYAIADAKLMAADDIAIYGDSVNGDDINVLANAYIGYGTYAKASAALYVAAGLHSGGNLYMNFGNLDVSADAYAGNGTVDVDVSLALSAASDVALYGDTINVYAPARGIYGASANAVFNLYAGTHNSSEDLYVGVDNIYVVADAAAIYSGNAYANAYAGFKATRTVKVYGDNLFVKSRAVTPSSGNAYATADLYMAAGLHSNGRLIVTEKKLLVSATAEADNNAVAVADANLTAANDVSVYIGDTLTVQGYAEAYGTTADADATLYIAAGTHLDYGDVYVDAYNSLRVYAGAEQSANLATENVYATATATMVAYNNVSVVTPDLNVAAYGRAAPTNNPMVDVDAGLYLQAGLLSSSAQFGNLYVDVTDLNVDARAYGRSFTTGNHANAYAGLTAANDVSVYVGDDLRVNAYADGNNTGDAYAYATLNMIAGTHSSTTVAFGNLYLDVGDTLSVLAHGYAPGHDAQAKAVANMQAYNDITVLSPSLTVQADALAGNSGGDTAFATAALYMGAGSLSSNSQSGDLYVSVNQMLVSADAQGGGTTEANAYAGLTAANDISLYANDTVTVQAYANSRADWGESANATLFMYAGTHGMSGDMYVDVYNTLLVNASASNTANSGAPAGNAYATAVAHMQSYHDITVLVPTLTVQAAASAVGSGNNDSAYASANLSMAAGSGSSGDLFVRVTDMLVSADAAGSQNVYADAHATFTAADDVTVYVGNTLTVQGSATGGINVASADVSLYMSAGTHGNLGYGNLYVDVGNTALVYAYAYSPGGDAYATATGHMQAYNDISVVTPYLTVEALANADQNAFAVADLSMAAGSDSSGDLYVHVNDETLVSASANAGNFAGADAHANFTAAYDVTFYGDTLNVLGFADASDTADASATLYMWAGSHSNGTLSADINYTLVHANVAADTNMYADAHATFNAADDLVFNGYDLTVTAYAGFADESSVIADASASLTMAAGTHGSDSGNLYADINTTRVLAGASGNGSFSRAYADAHAYFIAGGYLSFRGNYLEVNADALDYVFIGYGFADASATLDMHAGTHGSSGDLYVNVTTTDVNATANVFAYNPGVIQPFPNFYAYADAHANFTAASDLSFYGDTLTVGAYAQGVDNFGFGDALVDASATLYMGAGTHSNGSLYAGINTTRVLADASAHCYIGSCDFPYAPVALAGFANAYADAHADFYAADNLTFYGSELEVSANAVAADAFAYAFADASATLSMAAGQHGSSGDLYVKVTDTLVQANADAYANYVFLAPPFASAYADADAHMDLVAAGDLSFYGYTVTVGAYAQGVNRFGGFGSAHLVDASATLYMGAGTHSNGNLYASIDMTRVQAVASVYRGNFYGGPYAAFDYANVYADAHADFYAADNLTFNGSTLEVLADALASSVYVSARADASATLSMAAGQHGSSGDLYVVVSDTLVQANADAYGYVSPGYIYGPPSGIPTVSAYADAHMDLAAAGNLSFYGDTVTVGAYAQGVTDYGDGFGLADASATLSMTAGSHSNGSLYAAISTTRVTGYAFAFDISAAAYADAHARFYAADDLTFNGYDVAVTADATTVPLMGIPDASATLEMTAGSHSASGDLYLTFYNASVSAYADNKYPYADGTAFADARMILKAANNIGVYGETLSVYAGALSHFDFARGNADLFVYAGDSGGFVGNLYMDVTDTRVAGYAHAYFGGDAYADAHVNLDAANDIRLYGDTFFVTADASNPDDGDAYASATLVVAAGAYGTNGDLYMGINTTRVISDANANSNSAHAYAHAGLYAQDDITVYGDSFYVIADAVSASDSSVALASATLYMEAGTGSSGNLLVDINTTKVVAYASVDSSENAYANASAIFRAANDITVYGDSLTVNASAYLGYAAYGYGYNNFKAGANAYLLMAAGTHSNSGDLYVAVNATRVEADATIAYGYGYAYADANAAFTAANDVSIYGNSLSVLAYASGYAGVSGYPSYFAADASANLVIAAGTHGVSGDVYVDMSSMQVVADAYMYIDWDGNAYADAHADITAFNDISIYAGNLTVYAGASADSNASASATLTMAAGTGGTGNIYLDIGTTEVAAYAFADDEVAAANAYAVLTAANDITVNGGDFNVTAFASGSYAYAAGYPAAYAVAALGMYAGTAGTGYITVNNNNTLASAYAYAGDGPAYAAAFDFLIAPNDITVTGNLTANATAGTNTSATAYALAAVGVFAGHDINVANVAAYADAEGDSGFAYGLAAVILAASNDITVGNITGSAFASNNGSASALGGVYLTAGSNITVNGNVNMFATARNGLGPSGSGDAYAYGFLKAVAGGYGTLNMNGITVGAQAVCYGASGTCNPSAGAHGFITAPGDITLSGPISVQSFAAASNTGNTASAYAGLGVIGGNNVNVGGADVMASAYINHGAGNAIATGSAFIQANGSNTVGDIGVTANASGSGLSSGHGYMLVQTINGNNILNGGLSVNVGLGSGGSTNGYARLELDAAGSNGLNIPGPGFAVPHAEAGGASVTNVMSDIDVVNNATAQLVIPHVIAADNELTRRLVITWLEASGFLLPTAFDSDSLGDGHGRAGGATGGQHVIRNGTERSTIFNLPNGNGFGGFSVDENGNIIFRASFGGLPDNAELPLPPDLCETGEAHNKHLRGILNCGWENEPVFY